MNPLVFDDFKGIDWEEQVKRAEHTCLTIDRTHYFKYPLDGSAALVWSKRGCKKFRLQIMYSHYDNGTIICMPFVDADYFLIEKYAGRLSDFIEKFKDYCEWSPPPPGVIWNAPLNTVY